MNCVRQVLIALSFATSAAAQTVATATPRSPDDAVVAYGGFADVGYLFDFNEPTNKLFRSRGTTWHTDDLYLNMSGVYIKKMLADHSRWGADLLVHAGKDDEIFGLSATAPARLMPRVGVEGRT